MTDRTRVILIDLPRMLSETVRELLASEPDMEIVGEVPDLESALSGEERADVAVVSMEVLKLNSRSRRVGRG